MDELMYDEYIFYLFIIFYLICFRNFTNNDMRRPMSYWYIMIHTSLNESLIHPIW